MAHSSAVIGRPVVEEPVVEEPVVEEDDMAFPGLWSCSRRN
jgi:hypothetical protein